MTPDELEQRLGDPRDPANPLGFAAILAADEREELFTAGARALDGVDMSGGVELLRSVFRRDPRLGLAYAGEATVAAATGALDTGLRTTLRHVSSRQLYGRAVLDLPYIRATVVGSFVELLICDAYSTGATPAARYAVSRRLMSAMRELSVVLGARFYVREGEHGIFQKLLRDVEAIGLAHPAPGPQESVQALAVEDPDVAALLEPLATDPAARACVLVWQAATDGFLSDPAWLVAALARLRARPHDQLPEHVEKRLFVELVERHEALRGFGLARRVFPG